MVDEIFVDDGFDSPFRMNINLTFDNGSAMHNDSLPDKVGLMWLYNVSVIIVFYTQCYINVITMFKINFLRAVLYKGVSWFILNYDLALQKVPLFQQHNNWDGIDNVVKYKENEKKISKIVVIQKSLTKLYK